MNYCTSNDVLIPSHGDNTNKISLCIVKCTDLTNILDLIILTPPTTLSHECRGSGQIPMWFHEITNSNLSSHSSTKKDVPVRVGTVIAHCNLYTYRISAHTRYG